ncbi:MAG: hypothetical protein WCJ02_06465 [bacterium]
MKKLSILAIALITLVAVPTAFAKKGDNTSKVPSDIYAKYDVNKNGVLDADEKAALVKDFDADKTGPLQVLDNNKDGKLTDGEIATISPTKPGDAPVKAKAKGKKNK